MTIDRNTVAIRPARSQDAPTLAALGAATFTQTFGHSYPAEDLQAFLSAEHSVAAWQKTLADTSRAVWLAELSDATPIGFISVGACKLPVANREPNAGEIQQLYVLATHHNLKLGSRLMDAGVAWLEAQSRLPLYVGVWSGNHGAQRFYARYGFIKVGEYGFPVGKTVDHEFIMKRELAPSIRQPR